MAVLSAVAVVMAVSALILLWTMEERPAAVSQGANTLTHTVKSSLQAASGAIAAPSGTPAALRPGNALGALVELGALRGARVPAREQPTALACLTSERHK